MVRSSKNPRRANAIFFSALYLCIVAAGFFLFSKILHIGFLSDDWGYIYLGREVTWLQSLHFFWKIDPYGNLYFNFRPLISVVFVLFYKIFGMNAVPFHLLSIFLHGTIAWLVGYFFFRLVPSRLGAFLAATFVLVHPLSIETAVWLSNWTTLFSTLFLFITLIFYDFFREKKKSSYLVLIPLSLSLSLCERKRTPFPSLCYRDRYI